MVLANKVGMALYSDLRYLYDMPGTGGDHVAILLRLRMSAFDCTAMYLKQPVPYPLETFPILQQELANELFMGINSKEIQKFWEAWKNNDVNQADDVWNDMGDKFIREVLRWAGTQLKGGREGHGKRNGGATRRGQAPVCEERKVPPPILK